MSLRSRFPDVAAKHSPDPDLAVPDEEPASAYLRAAFLDSVQKFEPDARLEAFANVRLFGRLFADGVFEERAANIFLRLQSEINSAADEDDVDAVRIGFAHIDRGSVVLNLRPVAPEMPDDDQISVTAPSKLEAALMRVLDLHDAVEAGDETRALSAARGDLGVRLRQLVESLDEAGAGMEVDLSRSNGARRHSRIGEAGRANARRLFERHRNVDVITLSGVLRTTSTAGKIELTVDKRAVEIVEVPADIAKQLPWDQQLRISVRRTLSVARAGSKPKARHQYIKWLAHDEMFDDTTENDNDAAARGRH
ncbi:hypothetical protein [Rhodococcus aetherivorans]|uniref:hypothetical protein n=1 Tax=Rhodococcus aetherivorans TaxID=191292 RepID=UPI003890D9D0